MSKSIDMSIIIRPPANSNQILKNFEKSLFYKKGYKT